MGKILPDNIVVSMASWSGSSHVRHGFLLTGGPDKRFFECGCGVVFTPIW
jgi:hypothetical protein